MTVKLGVTKGLVTITSTFLKVFYNMDFDYFSIVRYKEGLIGFSCDKRSSKVKK